VTPTGGRGIYRKKSGYRPDLQPKRKLGTMGTSLFGERLRSARGYRNAKQAQEREANRFVLEREIVAFMRGAAPKGSPPSSKKNNTYGGRKRVERRRGGGHRSNEKG